MGTILHTIVDDARPSLEARKRKHPRSVLESMEGSHSDIRPFPAALDRDPIAVIAELKKRSPSKGTLRDDFDVARIAGAYEKAGAAALSVLTESNHFHGSLDFLTEARKHTGIPVLRKDFLTDPYELFEARAFGADAALLIATLLDRAQLGELLHAAREAGITCLVEVYDPVEPDHIDFDTIDVLGVNNRDLRTFAVDTARAPSILLNVPGGIKTVAESGLRSGRDLAGLARVGINAALIGESFMTHQDPGAALSRMLEETHRLLKEAEHHED